MRSPGHFSAAINSEGTETAYDLFGRASSSLLRMDSVSRQLTYQYDGHGNRTRLTYPDANYVTYNWDAANRPTGILRSGTTSIAIYGYSNEGYRTSFNGAFTTSYGYDAIGRLQTLTNNLPVTAYNNQWTFGYNPASQIVSQSRSNDTFAWTGSVNVTRVYAANGLNQYTSAGSAAFCYDANGNLTADGAGVYLYDIENRLVEKHVQGTGNSNCSALSYAGALQAALRYDPAGRLYEIQGTVTTRLLYDGDALIGEYNTAGTVLRRYVHGADAAADDPIAWFEGAGFNDAAQRIMRPDWQGSIVAVTDAAGANVLVVNRYDEFGIPQTTNDGRFQYTGQAWIPEIGMYYYKARIYSPTLGRFLQTDPIGYKDQLNLYAYVANDPVNNEDPSGNCTGSRIEGSDGQCAGGGFIAGSGSCSGNCNPAANQSAPGKAGPAPGATSHIGMNGLMQDGSPPTDLAVAGDTMATMQDDMDQRAVMAQTMSQSELTARREARANGALTGAAIVEGAAAVRGLASLGPKAYAAAFGRGGFLNSNKFLRIGEGFKQTGRVGGRAVGENVFRISIGRAKPYTVFGQSVKIHWHIDF